MKKWIICGQRFSHDDDDDLGMLTRTVKICECDSEQEAYDRLAQVRRSDAYEYEWIAEVES